ncbi:MAG TPA: glycosyltransferase family 2 protein [Candidatus Synoicihabitans sp.]|nr:glycosyltransferase family 2 protein [Candidatus Synoicihabitans sp.]
MTVSPRVSVPLPTYNHAHFLPAAIASVLAQESKDFELVISNDASTDRSRAVIEHYAGRDPRRAFRQPRNLGLVPHRNWCFGQARGQYIKYPSGGDCLAVSDSLRASRLHSPS